VKQLIHPHAGSVYKNRFPGKDDTLPIVYDQYKNPRPYPFTNLKHHFWWMINYVFDEIYNDSQDQLDAQEYKQIQDNIYQTLQGKSPTLNEVREPGGEICFMEEDHIPSFDFYTMIRKIVYSKDQLCDNCMGINIHGIDGYNRYDPGAAFKLMISSFTPNLGFTMNRKNWESVKKSAVTFCTFDDYNWDLTLTAMGSAGLISPKWLSPIFPRVGHIGVCGTHTKRANCDDLLPEIQKFESQINRVLKRTNGDWLKVTKNDIIPGFYGTPPTGQLPKGWGGWSHPFDHQHCLNQVKLLRENF